MSATLGSIVEAAHEIAPLVERVAASVAPEGGKRRVGHAFRRLVVAGR